jgi:Peptidase family M23
VEKYAVDGVRLGENGDTFSGDTKENAGYSAYGSEIVAVADGDIVSIKNDLPENVPGEPPVVSITVDTVGGNYVIQDLGKGRFAFYAHIIPASILVKPGDHVRRGDVLGHLSNSGNSTESHLHFHVMDGPDPLRSNSVPFIIDEFTRHDYEIVCEPPGQCQVLCLKLDQCIPVDGPRKLVIESSQVVPHQTFMDFDLGDFRNLLSHH